MTITINAKTDLTYEEIYEGHANGKSRLPKVLKQVEDGTNALAETTGVDILRRRTGGGNSTDVSGIGVSVTDPVAKLISAARYDALLSGYSPSGGEPSQNLIDSDVRGVTKNPFDLLDFVSGDLNSDQLKGSGDALATRAAKLKDVGSNQVVREFTEIVTGSINVRDRFGDRVGGGGETGAVHGEDQNIPGISTNTGSQAKVVGTVDGSSGFDFDGNDVTLGVDMDNVGADAVVYASADGVSLNDAAAETDAQLSAGAAFVKGDNVVLRSDLIGADGEVDVTEANTVLGFAASGAVVGQTAGAYPLLVDDTVIGITGPAQDVKNHIQYGTYQFGTLRIFTSINDAEPVAYVLHPDLLDDLIANQ